MSSFLHKLSGPVLKSAINWMSKQRLSQHSGKIRIQGLKKEVEIRRDQQGVPYIFAKNRHDMFFAQGFVHAQDRLWQMEINRRVAMGTLSEVFGEAALETDRLNRTLGLYRIGCQDLELLPKDMRSHLDAFCEGVNECIRQMGKKLPVEFKLAAFKPEAWEPTHILAFTRLMTLQLSNGWAHELGRALLFESMDPFLAREFDIRHEDKNPPTLPNGIEMHELLEDGKLNAIDGPFLNPMGGSNAWAVSGSNTDTGKPYLCGDPHLGMSMPGIWYQVYMQCPDYRVQGVSIPGMPLVLIGHNEKISWSVTLAFSDIQDLFIEEFNENDPTLYLYKDEWLKAEVIEEKIKIKGKSEPYIEKVTITRNGPAISESLAQAKTHKRGHKICLKSKALQTSTITMGWYGLNLAQNWDGFVESVEHLTAPGLNIVYADVDGNIGYWMTGKTPIRSKGFGEFPACGWDGDTEWTGEVPFHEMPHGLNPKKGFVVSANNKVIPEDFPYFMGNVWMNGYRAARITDLLSQNKKFGIADFAEIQMDLFCKPGKEFVKHFRDLKPESEDLKEIVIQMLRWDGILSANSIGGSMYQVCRREMLLYLYEESAKDMDALHSLTGAGPHPLMFKVNEYQGKDTIALLDMLSNPDSQVIAAAGGKTKVLRETLSRANEWLRKNYGSDPEKWKWKYLHRVEFPHAMSVKKPMDMVFNLGPYPIYGDTDTVCQTSILPHEPYNANLACPSYRQIIDLSDFGNSLWVKPPGQSGQLGHANYDDQVRPWLKGEYFQMYWHRAQIEQGADIVLHLEPQTVKN